MSLLSPVFRYAGSECGCSKSVMRDLVVGQNIEAKPTGLSAYRFLVGQRITSISLADFIPDP